MPISRSLYIHIPFCRRKCFYCDFCSVAYDRCLAGRYVDVICRQLEGLEGEFSTIYIGGGTPTVLAKELWEKIFNRLERFSRRCREFTIEANPESLTAARAALFRDNGVNRLSIGIQSFDDIKLRRLGRCHDARKAGASVKLARQAGFENISIDLIFGAPGESLRGWKDDLSAACALPVRHISAYALTYERGTRLYKILAAGNNGHHDDGAAAAMYEYAMKYLPSRGFAQYEVSNFSRKGFACRHNLGYWEGGEYAGIGASAVSYLGGMRQANDGDVPRFIKKALAGKSIAVSRETLPVLSRAREAAAVKIRTRDGIGFGWFRHRFGVDFTVLEREALKELFLKKLVAYIRRNGKIMGVRLTRKGFLFCDEASRALV